MGKKSSQSSPTKTSKREKKPQLNSLMKIMRPKVYITDTFNFKTLVQQLTGNGQNPPLESSPHPSSWEVQVELPYVENYQDFSRHNIVYQEDFSNGSFGASSCFTGSLEASPDNLTADLHREMGESEKMEFYNGLESMLMEMDSGSSDYDACCSEMFQMDQVCGYNYDLSNFV